MNVYDHAYALGKALQESSELKQLADAVKSVGADPDARRMLEEFQQQQQELQESYTDGELPSDEEMQSIQEKYEEINQNALIAALFQAEQRAQVMMQDIQRIVSESFEQAVGMKD
ncbi:YlbF family regulator [Marinicrinis lubricantis]|uniref:YlbF family regulator n=1 Tax=Marinicrinis lubricantis TaxID=2086470 RepID=A0ABW1IJ51_9BACL